MMSNKFFAICAFTSWILLLGSISFSQANGQEGIGIANIGDPSGTGHPPCNASLHLDCINGTCACITGYSSTPDKNIPCRKTYGQPCSYVLDCNIDRFLGCDEDKLCTCQVPKEQVFDEERQNCVSLIGFNCYHDTGNEFSLHCVKNAFCDMPIINGSMVHMCTCNEGYQPTDDGFCAGTGTGTTITSSVQIILTLLILLRSL
jgi:hypothetical protein